MKELKELLDSCEDCPHNYQPNLYSDTEWYCKKLHYKGQPLTVPKIVPFGYFPPECPLPDTIGESDE